MKQPKLNWRTGVAYSNGETKPKQFTPRVQAVAARAYRVVCDARNKGN